VQEAVLAAGAAAAAGAATYVAYRKRLLSRLLTSLRLKVNPDSIVEVASSAESLGISRQQVSTAVRSLRSCPKGSERLAESLVSLGLYEDVIYLASRGCSVPSVTLRRARTYSLGLALSKWEAEASRLLQEQPRLSGNSKVMVAVCEGDYREVMVDGVVTEVPPPGSSWRSPPPEEVMSSIAELSGAKLIISWGSCGLRGAVDARRLVRLAYPDVRPSLASIAYSLGVNPMLPPSAVALAAVESSVDILNRVGVEWDKMPEDVRGASEIVKYRDLVSSVVGQRGVNEQRSIVVTDRPRAYMPLWRPFSVNPSRAPQDDYVAAIVIKALASRGGDPLRAIRLSSLDGDEGRSIAKAIMASLVQTAAGPRPGSQVEPWDLACLDDIEVLLDCARTYGDCLPSSRPPPDEEELIRKLRVRCPGAKNIRLTANSYVPQRLAESLGIAAPNKGKVKAYGEPIVGGLRGASEAVSSAVAMASGASRPLIIVPTRALARAAASAHGGTFITAETMDSWFSKGGLGFISWDDYLVMPEAGGVADRSIIVFPERLIRAEPEDTAYGIHDKLVDYVIELVVKNGGLAVSRALYAEAERRDDIELVAPSRPEIDVELSDADIMEEAENAFKRLWGADLSLRPYQGLAVRVLAQMASSGRASSLMVILPTGAGKSAIFQVTAKALEDLGLGSTAIVISPLRALMHDQVKNARSRGLRAAYIDSSVPPSRKREIIAAAREGLLDLVYVTPEGFSSGPASELVSTSGEASLVVLDEAHALSRWGLSFRPSYLYVARQLKDRASAGWPPIVALTASAPSDVVRDVLGELGYSDYEERRISLGPETAEVSYSGKPVVLRAPSLRPEISIDVVPARDGPDRLEDIALHAEELTRWADSLGEPWVGIVFVPFVQSDSRPWLNAEEVAKFLGRRLGEDIAVYHGQLSDSERRRVEEEVVSSSRTGRGPRIVVATKAFGMGVDIPNIRWTLHAAPSGSVEDLYQEIGRAGRDGKPARAVILYNPTDMTVQSAMAKGEAIRPLGVHRTLQLIAEAMQCVKYRDGVIPIPIKGREGEWGLVKYLDVLRVAGLVDYEVVRGPLLAYDLPREKVEEEAGWCIPMSDGTCISRAVRGLEGRRVYFNICDNDASIGLKSQENCKSISYDGLVALVSVASGWRRPRRYLDPELYAISLWLSLREGRKVKELSDLLEAAVAARARGGQQLADSQVKRAIEELLAKGLRPPLGGVRLGKVVRCDSVDECVDRAIKDVIEVEELVGEGSVVIGASPTAAPLVSARYLKLTGRSPSVSPSYYRRLASLARRGELEKAMNMGYVVVVAKDSEKVNEVIKLVHGYPYASFYLYARSKA
jgi:ATP-dependent DNA helicase RecQ